MCRPDSALLYMYGHCRSSVDFNNLVMRGSGIVMRRDNSAEFPAIMTDSRRSRMADVWSAETSEVTHDEPRAVTLSSSEP